MAGEAVRWRRYGHDRLYVAAADGVKLGYRDLLAAEDHLLDQSREAEFTEIVMSWLASRGGAAVPEQRAVVASGAEEAGQQPGDPATHGAMDAAATSSAAETESRWEDLAQRRAGAMARQQANTLKQAAPVRTFVARVLSVHTEERAWRIGADGEEKVAMQLAKLARRDPGWCFLHAIPVGQNGSDIDHLVVGPGGVFSLNAKHHPASKVWVGGDTLMINGQRQPYIRNSRHEAARATKLLTSACGFPVLVTGVVVPVGADDITVKSPPTDVKVVNRMRLVRWLRDQPMILSRPQVQAIFTAARRSTTWQPNHSAGRAPTHNE